MREIDRIPVRLHKVDLTWDLVDELMRDLDSVEADATRRRKAAWVEGYEQGSAKYICEYIENHSYELDRIIAEEVADATRETGA